jgi:hypothetical protein
VKYELELIAVMNKSHHLLLAAAIILLFPFTHAHAQETCGLQKPLAVSELKGRVLFDFNGALFAVKDADVGVSYKAELAYQGIANATTDENGRFEIKGIKPGKYFISVETGRVGVISLMEFNVVPKLSDNIVDNQIEFVLSSEPGKECGGGYVKTVKFSDTKSLSGSSATPEEEAITEISLERTGCFGSCPIYKVILRKDGTATYIGKRFVSRLGTYHGKVEYGFLALAELVYRQGFFNLKERYAAPYTDLSTAIVSVVRHGKRKTVENCRGEAPIELWGIEMVIDALADDVKWTEDKSPKGK